MDAGVTAEGDDGIVVPAPDVLEATPVDGSSQSIEADTTGDVGTEAPVNGPCAGALQFADPELERQVRNAARVLDGPLFSHAVQSITTLEIMPSIPPIHSLRGIECLTELTSLYVFGQTDIVDLTPLSSLKKLVSLIIDVCGGPVDLGPLATSSNLLVLYLEKGCGVRDVAPIGGLKHLYRIKLNGGSIPALAPFLDFPDLSYLNLQGNPFDCEAEAAHLQMLRMRNVELYVDCP